MSALLERLKDQREEQISFVRQTLERAETETRDLVPAELSNVAAAKQRVAEIDAQIGPIVEFEQSRAAGAEVLASAPTSQVAAQRRGAAHGAETAGFAYRTAGAYLLDVVRAKGVQKWGWAPDPAAAERLAAAGRGQFANQTTGDTPGLMPTPVIGPVVNTLDASRPFLTSVGVKALAGIPGTAFTRPKITQHVDVGVQAAEKTALTSRAMKIVPVPFPKQTFGGYVNISRQDIDWSSPAAWDALLADLADVYGLETEDAAVAAFLAAIDPANVVALPNADPTLKQLMTALYRAAAMVYRGGGKLPDRIWCSLDMWVLLGSMTDTQHAQMRGATGDVGDSTIATFAGNLLDLPRFVVPTAADGTLVVGVSSLFEAYEEQLGVITAVEPSILGVEVAYGGYTAWGMLEAKGFAKVTLPNP